MSEKNSKCLPEAAESSEVYMQAGIVDQLNTNQQSNMTLSSQSFITQSYSTVKINSV
jgi:hypothetical protein